MFSEEVDWDVPEHIKNLNEIVFHSNIKEKSKVKKKIQKEQRSNKQSANDCVEAINSKPQKKKGAKMKVKKALQKSTSLLLETKVNHIKSDTEKLQKKKRTHDRIEQEKSSPEQSSKLKQLQKQKPEKQLAEQFSYAIRPNEPEQQSTKLLRSEPGSSKTKKNVKHKLATSDDETGIAKKAKSEKRPHDGENPGAKKTPMNVNRLKAYLKNAKQLEERAPVNEVTEGQSRLQNTLSLGDRMSSQLNAARFRYINEQLYSCTGKEAAELFANDNESFVMYHTGFRSQVDKWPVNPVDKMIDYIRESDKSAVVADFGCGDAKIAQSVPNVVHSFDLVALNSHVVACDMRHVALPSSSVDIAVFCLSLMGTNLVEYLCEANRVLKMGSVLLIAEVVSRFEKVGKFAKKLHKLGFSLIDKNVDNKMFVWLEFTKTSALPSKDQLPDLQLLPCLYKKR